MKKTVLALVLFTLALTFATPASAGPLAISCPNGMTDQTSNAALTFSGSGIPKDAVCTGTFGSLTLFLTATQRYTNPVVTNNGAGTYFATAGDDTANGQPNYATWNFDWAVFNSSTTGAGYKVTLSWDTDPGAGTDTSQFGFITSFVGAGGSAQDSWNLGMTFIDTGAATSTYKPASGLFNQYMAGIYGFKLNAAGTDGSNSTIAMEVNVGAPAPVPEPASLLLLGGGLSVMAVKLKGRKTARASK